MNIKNVLLQETSPYILGAFIKLTMKLSFCMVI